MERDEPAHAREGSVLCRWGLGTTACVGERYTLATMKAAVAGSKADETRPLVLGQGSDRQG